MESRIEIAKLSMQLKIELMAERSGSLGALIQSTDLPRIPDPLAVFDLIHGHMLATLTEQ